MEIGPFQRQYLDSVENPHASAAQLIARLDVLYRVTNALVANFGSHGIILHPTHQLINDVKNALHDLDGGIPRD